MIDILSWTTRAFATNLTLLATGSAFLIFSTIRLPELSDFARRAMLFSSFAALVATLGWLAVVCAELAGDWNGISDPYIWHLVLSGAAGDLVLWRFSGLAMLILLAISNNARRPVIGIAALATLIGFSRYGHSLSDPSWLYSSLLVIHLMIASWWLAVVPLLLFSLAKHKDEALQLASRFGTQAGIAMPVLIIAGACFAWLRNGDAWLLSSAWGFSLSIKLLVVLGLLSIGAINRWIIVPSAHISSDTRPLRKAMIIDILLFVTAITISSWMTGPGAME